MIETAIGPEDETETQEAPNLPPGPTVKHSVKHQFTPQEREEKVQALMDALSNQIAAEQQKKETASALQAAIEAAKAAIIANRTALQTGYEMRTLPCRVVFRPKDRKKDFYREDTGALVATENMNPEDFAQDLLQAEAKFERREEIELFPPTGQDKGLLIVGRQGDRWFAALRVNIGAAFKLEERLDSEQRSVKARFDAIKQAAKRLREAIGTALGADAAKGFETPINAAIEKHREREE